MKKLIYICTISAFILVGSALKSSAQYYDYLVPNVPEVTFENPDQPKSKFAVDTTKNKQAFVKKISDKLFLAVDKNKNKQEKRKIEAKKEE